VEEQKLNKEQLEIKKLLTPTQEDYLETIYDLTQTSAVTRNKEIAENLGVRRATVTRAVKVLAEKGLVNHETHGYITLTSFGKKIAQEISSRHKLFRHFFKDILELGESESDVLACKIEHLISGEALSKFRELVAKIDVCEYKCKEENELKGSEK
jgi:DtxR family transcriptional regulator, Mn-dependent transcriptional regulator